MRPTTRREHRKVANFPPASAVLVPQSTNIEVQSTACQQALRPRVRERGQFATARPKIRNKTAFSLVRLGKDAYICSSDRPPVRP